VLRLHGPLLLGNSFRFRPWCAPITPTCLIDVADMPYIDSAGIGCLVGRNVSRENSGRKLVLVGATTAATSLKVTRVDQLFILAPDVQAALHR